MNEQNVSRISSESVFNGRIVAEGDVQIDGYFDGSLFSNANLVVGDKANVKGNFICNQARIGGVVEEGMMVVGDTLTVASSGNIQDGKISFRRLQVDLGAKLEGRCHVLTEGEFERISAEPLPEKKGEA